jgi:uncharacterized protein (DUF2252 family)
MGTEEVLPLLTRRQRRRADVALTRARRRTSLQALDKLTEEQDGRYRIINDPPLLERLSDIEYRAVGNVFSSYRATLSEELRRLLDCFQLVDAARKVVGVGSVGTRCYVVLLQGRSLGEPLFLQIKEAQASVLQRYLPGPSPKHQGRRVVAGQRLMQSASDIFLGWTTGPAGRHFYGRQLRDMKGSAMIEQMSASDLADYAALCGRTLAQAHARSGDRIAIAGYLGTADTFDIAIADFAVRYIEQTLADHAALTAAIAAGRLPAATE